MVSIVPSLEGSLYLKDPQSIIAYTLRMYCRTPGSTIPFLSELVISLQAQIALFGKQPDQLVGVMQTDLQGVFGRIFQNERQVTASVTYTDTSPNTYDVTISVIYTLLNGELSQTGGTISLKDGFLQIPEDTIEFNTFMVPQL
jgi:hypothetical protein